VALGKKLALSWDVGVAFSADGVFTDVKR